MRRKSCENDRPKRRREDDQRKGRREDPDPEVRECVMLDFPLYHYRMGKSPNRKPRILTEEEREALRQRMARIRQKQLFGE